MSDHGGVPLPVKSFRRRRQRAKRPRVNLGSGRFGRALRLNMWLLARFAGLAALLAAVGIYGVMAYSVIERTHQIGVRMALGAGSNDMLRMALLDGAKAASVGVVVGLDAAFALTRVMSSLLYNVSAADPMTFSGISALIVCVSVIASYIPARKASRVDPIVALR